MKLKIDGYEIEGSAEEIARVLEISKGGKVYISDSKGVTLVSEMNSWWLKNAILKIYREWLDTLKECESDEDLLDFLIDGPVGFSQFDVLYEELVKRARG